MAHLNESIVEVKAEDNCLAHALKIGIASVHNDANYTAYRRGRNISPVVQALLKETGIDLTRSEGFTELNHFHEHFRDYKIVVYQGLWSYDLMFEGQVDSSKHLNLIYDDVERHYHVITNLTSAMAKRYYVKHVIEAVSVR